MLADGSFLDFQLSQKQVEKTLPDYGVAINPSYAQAAAK